MPTPRALRLLHPKWLPLHLFVVAACVAMVLLGRWQWHVAHQHHGDIRYYAYAFQWWAFSVFAVVMWARIVGDYLSTGRAARAAEVPAASVPAGEGPAYLAYVPPTAAEPETDPERARFNAYLAELAEQDRRDRNDIKQYELKGDE